MRHSRRHGRFNYNKRRHTVSVIFEVSVIIVSVSLLVHLSSLSPCGQSNPITWFAYILSPEEVTAKCASSLIQEKVINAHQASKTIENISQVSGVEIDMNKYNTISSRYEKFIPKSGNITIDNLKQLPSDAKALCDSNCRVLVKKYLKENNGRISVSKIRDGLK